MPEIQITKQELDVRMSNGTVYICRSCRDNLNKIILLRYEAGKRPAVITGFCSSCLIMMEECKPCAKLRRVST